MKKRLLAGLLALTMTVGMPVTVRAEEITGSNTENIDQNQPEEAEDEVSEDQQGSEDAGTVDEITDTEKIKDAEGTEAADTKTAELSYRVHVQTHGWQDDKHSGETAGTTGQSKRLEAMELSIKNAPYEGGIEYRTHVQTYGWQDWVSDGEVSGTSGQAKRLEAMQIRLTGELAEHYDVYYRVHAQTYGWLGWAKNGERAGTASYGKRLEAMEIVLVEKGQGLEETGQAYYAPVVQYQTHVQTYGWQKKMADGATSGTVGEGKRLEAIKINLFDSEALGYEGGIEYRTHVQTYGWQDWVSDGGMSGTSGESKRLEALEVRLTGELANHYDVYYRVHCQTLGWLGWAKNGDSAGTEGFSKRLEGVEICLVDKNSADVPDTSGQAYVSPLSDDCVQLFGRLMEDIDGSGRDLIANGNDQSIGLSDDASLLESFGMRFAENSIGGSVRYRVSCQDGGWKDWVSEGDVAGTMDENKHLEAVQMELMGTVGKLYDIYYRTRVESYGWLGWSKNGEPAGTDGYSKGIEAIQVRIVVKGQGEPKSYELPYLSKSGAAVLGNPCPSAWISDEFGPRIAPTTGASTYHKGRDYAAPYYSPIYAAASGKIAKVDYNYFRGNYVIVDHGHGLSTVYQHCSRINVKQGDSVFVGSKIAEVGTTGISTGPHLHFEVWVEGVPVDPRKYLK